MHSEPTTLLATLPTRCLVGVSGGIDSVVLLHALVAAGKKPIVLHFDHCWRKESRKEVQFTRGLAKQYGLKFITARAPRGLKISEQSARRARWDFFKKAARETRCKDLVLAHHADDQVETFLLQLLRGGGSGARGMAANHQRKGLIVHRPWLPVWRSEIEAYARCNKIQWRDDPTNRDTRLLRNRLRHRLLPYLKKHFSKDAPQALWRAAEILSAESEWLDTLCEPQAASPRLNVKELREMPIAQVRRIIRHWLLGQNISDISFDDIEAVRGLIINRFPAKVNLSENLHARRREGFLFVERM